MISSEKKIERIKEFVSHIYNVFEEKPGMLGRPVELPSMLWIVDCISDMLLDDVVDQNQSNRRWEDFLIEKKLLVGADNKLAKILSNDDFEFSYLQELRREYFAWKENTVTHT
ncbi:hypothetical protein [Lysobacter hankyongensis]|uniref:Uncharacterized protein n=1 Tax=Lysobacter hankyongensis TaxID=1176535 RepID=A0ABP9C9T8_9GAMM